MNSIMTEYVVNLKKKYMDKNELNVIYYKDGNKLKKMFSDNSETAILNQIKDYIQNYDHEPGYAYIMISLKFKTKRYIHGPVTMICTLLTIGKNNKIDETRSAIGTIRYTDHEIKQRGFKTTDYKKLYNKVRKNQLTDYKKVFYAKDLDKK